MNLNTYYDGVANNGVMTNVRQEKIRMEGKVKWNVPSISDFTKTTVTIALQKYNETNHQWETLLDDGSNTYTKTLSGFRVTSPTKSHVFPDVEKYDESGNEIKYRVIQTNVDYTGVSPTVQIPISSYNPKDPLNPSEPYFTAPFTMNEKNYSAVAAPTPDTDNSYTIENRLAGDMQLKLTKFWKDSNGQGFGITDCASYPNITINVYQHGTNSNYLVPYMTITTNGTKGAFGNHGVDVDSYDPEPTEKTVPFNIKYRDRPDDDPETGVIQVTTGNTGDRASKWEFKIEVSDGVYKDISLPAFNENGNAYSYTVEESPVANAHTTYSYERVGNDLSANINNTYAIGGGGITVTFQKEWIDGTDISHEKPVKIAIVRIKKNGSFYYTDDEQIDLTDNFGKTHIVELKDSSNWYGQCGIDTTKTQEINGETKNCFDYIDLGEGKKRFLYTAIELNMSQNSADDYSRVVNYDGNSSVKESREAKLEADIANPTDPSKRCTEFNGTIDAYLDSVYGESHLPGYDVEVKAGSTTDSVVGARKYVVVNKRKGQVNVVFNKTWQDGSNSEETRNGKYRVYLYQNGKRVVSKADPAGPLAPEDSITSAEGDVTTLDVTSPQQVEYTKDSHPDTQEFSFVGLPQYDEDGNIYHYSVREFLVKDDRELEIALTDTKDSTKTGYVITDNSEETSFSVPETDSSMLVRNDTFNYTNTITGEKTGGASFYVLWHDQTSYDNGHRPDVNYVLYYKAKGESDDKLQVYNGEYKVEWHPMYDDEAKTVASRYYQYATFTKLPLANDQGIPYEYYAVPSLNNPGEHYKEAYYKSNAHVVAATKDESPITTGAGRKHYDMGAGSEADKLPDGSKMLPENGIVEYIIDEYINVKGNKLWKLSDSGDIDVNKYPDAEIYLWRFNDHDEDNKENPDFTNALDKTTLNEKTKADYAFMDKDAPTQLAKYPKYDPYGLLYKYSVSEKIYINNEEKYHYSIPSYVMHYQSDTNGITNVYDHKEGVNLRQFKVTKNWNSLSLADTDKKPVAEFGLYRIEIPLKGTDNASYYTNTTSAEGTLLSPNPTRDAYDYAIAEFKKFRSGDKNTAIEQVGVKTITYSAGTSYVTWDNMPIFTASGLVYLYFAEERNKQGIESFEYDVLKDASGDRPAVINYDSFDPTAGKTNVLISYDIDKKDKVRAVLFSNNGLNPSNNPSGEEKANYQEAGYTNSFKTVKLTQIVGYKVWDEGLIPDAAEKVRPVIDDGHCSEVTLALTRSAATQDGHKNPVAVETIPQDKYDIQWSKDSTNPNRWKFVLTPKDADNEFKLYATNGRPYTYTVTESINGNTLTNYKITTKAVSGSENYVKDNILTFSSSLKNTLKGQVRVLKKWDDALNELNLRSGHVNVLLQYRLVPSGSNVGEYNVSNPSADYQWKNYPVAGDIYVLTRANTWQKLIDTLPVKTRAGERYEYRLLETEFKDLTATVRPIDITNSGKGSVNLNKVPNGGLCTDGSSEEERKSKYGNSTSTVVDGYKNKCYEIKIEDGNYIVNNSPIASLDENDRTVSSMNLQVDNRLAKTTALKIEKKWKNVNIGEPSATPVDTYGVLPDRLTFDIQYKNLDDGDIEANWKPLKDDSGKPVSVTITKDNDDNSFVATYDTNLPKVIDTKQVVYRAVEKDVNLGRFKITEDATAPQYDNVSTVNDARTVCHTTVTNTLPYRNITIKKKWNADSTLRNPVTIELLSDNFTNDGEVLSLVNNTTEQTLSADNDWEVSFNNLPIYNTAGTQINYYVRETKVDGKAFSDNNYAIHFFAQISETGVDSTDYSTVTGGYNGDGKSNIAHIPADAYKMYVVNTPKISLNVNKTWDDEDNRQGLRETVKVDLTNDGSFSVSPSTQQLLTAQKYSATWNYLPIYKSPNLDLIKGIMDYMDKVNYTIKEAYTSAESSSLETNGYKTPVYNFGGKTSTTKDGFIVNLNISDNKATITNSYNPPRISFTATKKWEDENNRHYSRPTTKGIYMTLYYRTSDMSEWKIVKNISADYADKNYPDGSNVYTTSSVTQHVQGSDANTWGTPLWENLPTKASNKPILYKVFETDENGKIQVTPGYKATYDTESVNATAVSGSTASQIVTNTLETKSISISKEWKNTYDVHDRPTAVTFVIEYKCGAEDTWKAYEDPAGTKLQITLNVDNHVAGNGHIWRKDIENLPSMNSEGIKYEYRAKEISVTYGTTVVEAQGDFKYKNGSWKAESKVGIYNSSVDTKSSASGEDSIYSYEITAVNTPVTGELTVVKKWDDENNRDNVRPAEIRLQLYRKQDQTDAVPYGNEVIVVAPTTSGSTAPANEWTYTFKDLPVYNNDALEYTEENKSVYYVQEVNSAHGYKPIYTPENGESTEDYDSADNILIHNSNNTYTAKEIITNKYEPVRIKITAHKEWIDNNNAQNTRPSSVEFKLQYHIVGGPDGWRDVTSVSSVAALHKTGSEIETTSPLVRTLKHNTDDPDNKWLKDKEGNTVIWENLPAYVNYGTKNGAKVEYQIYEYDSTDTDSGKTISDHYRVNYDECWYVSEYGNDYSLKATNILNGTNGVLKIEKKWNPNCKDNIAENDKIVSEIKCRLLQKSKAEGSTWETHPGGEFTLSHADNWQHIFADLTTTYEYKVEEYAIVYKNADGSDDGVTVNAVDDKIGSYEWSVITEEGENAQMTATITNKLPERSITVSKKWEDENNRDGLRPNSITVILKRDGKRVGEPVELYPETGAVGSKWTSHEWKNLPIYVNGSNTIKSKYTVEELRDSKFAGVYETKYTVGGGEPADTCTDIEFDEFKSSENVSVVITNRHETHKETITARKSWVDGNNIYKTRPEKPLSSKYHTYLMLLYKIEGHAEWKPVNYYNYDEFEKDGYQYRDHHIYTTDPVIQEVTGDESEEWESEAIWENVSTKGIDADADSDTPVLFTVIEVPGLDYDFNTKNDKTSPFSVAPAGYSVSELEPFEPETEAEHGHEKHENVINTLITTSLEVTKIWDDQGNKYKTRPDKIRVKLERKHKSDKDNPDKKWSSVQQLDKTDTVLELSDSNEWKGTFDNLPLYDSEKSGEELQEYIYRAVETALIYGSKEVPIVLEGTDSGMILKGKGGNYIANMVNTSEGSTTTPDNMPKFKLNLTNSLKNDDDTTSLTVIKKWQDENNRDRLRTDSVTVNLLRDGEIVDTQNITGTTDPAWKYTWDKLPLYKNGETKGLLELLDNNKKSVYTVTEEPVAGYNEPVIAKSADTESGTEYTITNIHIPQKAAIVADKIWQDSENAYSTRPKDIYLRLLYKFAGESDSEYRIVPKYTGNFAKEHMYTSEDADGVFTTSEVTQKCSGEDVGTWANAARWDNLPLKAQPNSSEYDPLPVVYKVIEVPSSTTDSLVYTSEGYTGYDVIDASIGSESLNTDTDNRLNITNKLITTELNIIKVFDDEDNKYNTRPDSIEVQVLRRLKSLGDSAEWLPVRVKGGLFGNELIVTLTKAEAFSKKLTDLPKYDMDGNEYEYTCLEKKLVYGDKKISVDKSNVTADHTVSEGETQIKNTLVTTSLTVTKEWDDNSNARGARPDKIVFSVERKVVKDIASQLIGKLTEWLTGKDGYSELKMLSGGKEVPVEIIINGPDFKAYTLDGLPAYSEDGNLYSYRAIETKLVYGDREVLVEKETSLYEQPVYEFNAVKSGKDAKGNTAYKYDEKVVNKIIPLKNDPVNPEPSKPGPVIIGSVKPTPKYELLGDVTPEVLPQKVTEKIYDLIDLPDDDNRKVLVQKLYNDLVKIIQEDPAFIDRLDEETADIVITFLTTGVLGRRRTKLPKTGGVVGSVMGLLLAAAFIGAGIAIRPGNESDKKKRHKRGRKA